MKEEAVELDDRLKGKSVLIVDDEPDILGSLEDLLDMCEIHKAEDFETAKNLLESRSFDAAILDIMGVNGYELLDITTRKNIPTLMLTAHALSKDNFFQSIKGGAQAYVPKDKITEIAVFLNDILEASEKGRSRSGKWFARLEQFFEKKFGEEWRDQEDEEFWKKYFYI
jgi:DNA-binding NtrC family response regulator